MTPATILAKAMAPLDTTEIGQLAELLDIPRPQIWRATTGAHGQPTRAEYHLKLCAYLGVDPVTGTPTTPGRIVRFDALLFAMAVKMSRFLRLDLIRDAAKAMKISTSVLSRIEHGDVRSFESMLAACRYGNLIPNNYVIDDVSRNATGKSLTLQENRSAA